MGLSLGEVSQRCEAIVRRVEEVIVGKRDVVELVLVGVLANGHVLIEDYPGLAKTLLARCFAQVTGLGFARVQFTPDLMPSDVTGSSVFDQGTGEVSFRAGPVFTNLLLGDEINRAPPKTQAALLEAMAERQVTVEGVTRRLEPPFVVLATQNPIEFEGTYPLPEAQLDRFLLRVRVGYPTRDDEFEVVARRIARRSDDVRLDPVVDRAELVAMQAAIEDVFVDDSIGYYVVDLVAATRTRPAAALGASPRGTLAVLLAARARAVLSGRDFVTPEDVKAVAVAALAHRVALRPEEWVRGARSEDVVATCLETVPTPTPTPDDEAGAATGTRQP
ncbi:MAG: AAA family ATPase [Acidimicrobiales bacterium]